MGKKKQEVASRWRAVGEAWVRDWPGRPYEGGGVNRAKAAHGEREAPLGRRDATPGPPVRGDGCAGLPSPDAADALWRLAAHGAQLAPDTDWRTWLFLGGRGAGKTRAGAEWIASLAARMPKARFALVGATMNDVREVMIEGASGLMSLPNRTPPVYEPSRRRLVWENGATAHAFSAEEPNRLRGPQFHAAWGDEFCAWARPQAALANLRLGLRLQGLGTGVGPGAGPRLCLTTTPRPIAALRALRAEGSCVATHAGTMANAAHLAEGFVDGLMEVYGGTSLAAQEIEGLVVEGSGALFTAALLARARDGFEEAPMARVLVAVDPPAGLDGAACGIVVAGRAGVGREARFVVLADWSVRGAAPSAWAMKALEAARAFGAHAIVAEANQGGEMVRTVINMTADRMGAARPRVELVHAARGKAERAMPAAALYEQGRVSHAGLFRELEEELMALGSGEEAGAGQGAGEGATFDRADALVWALTELSRPRAEPRVFMV